MQPKIGNGICKDSRFCSESCHQEILWLEVKNDWTVSILALTVNRYRNTAETHTLSYAWPWLLSHDQFVAYTHSNSADRPNQTCYPT